MQLLTSLLCQHTPANQRAGAGRLGLASRVCPSLLLIEDWRILVEHCWHGVKGSQPPQAPVAASGQAEQLGFAFLSGSLAALELRTPVPCRQQLWTRAALASCNTSGLPPELLENLCRAPVPP